MAIKITEECINCGACEPECPNNAIYEGGVEWSISDGTTVKGNITRRYWLLPFAATIINTTINNSKIHQLPAFYKFLVLKFST